ncbi:MAG: hypothetical protein GY829_00450, partial [Gammaproteobacteria bacterium]|nr:hypothetical protein [Gammaproteobacteria bacterium]
MFFIRKIINTVAISTILFATSVTSISFASNLDGMTREEMSVFISDMPKAELHIHLSGTLSPQTVVKLANRNN